MRVLDRGQIKRRVSRLTNFIDMKTTDAMIPLVLKFSWAVSLDLLKDLIKSQKILKKLRENSKSTKKAI